MSGVWPLRIPVLSRGPAFPADCLHRPIFTAGLAGEYGADTPGFPANSQIYLRNYNGQLIVTAAVYRRFSSELRPEGLTPPLNVPAPGRRQCIYIVLRLRMHLCF